MIRKLIIYLSAVILITGCKNNTVHISGSLGNAKSGEYIFLNELRSNELKSVDSVLLTDDGSFDLNAEVKSPSFYLLKLNNNNFLTMLVEPGEKLILKAHHDSLNYPVSVQGSEGTLLMAGYNKRLRRTINSLYELNRRYMENTDSAGLPALMQELDSLAQVNLSSLNRYTKQYIDSNLKSMISLVALYQQVAPGVSVLDAKKDWKYFVKVDSSLFSRYPDYEPVKNLHNEVKELVAGMEIKGYSPTNGGVAPDIVLPTPEGDTVALSSTRGTIVLLDFWASWCAPCRMENPNLVRAYDLYHRKGFQIYQVSLDKTKEAWLRGIEDDKLGRWIHVSDIQYWNSVVVPLYGIEKIPSNFLIDGDGRIIATNLRGERLQQKLGELFSKR